MNIDAVERARVLLRQVRPLLDRDDNRAQLLWENLYDAVSAHLPSGGFGEPRHE